jgi:hypothetical protein
MARKEALNILPMVWKSMLLIMTTALRGNTRHWSRSAFAPILMTSGSSRKSVMIQGAAISAATARIRRNATPLTTQKRYAFLTLVYFPAP